MGKLLLGKREKAAKDKPSVVKDKPSTIKDKSLKMKLPKLKLPNLSIGATVIMATSTGA